VVVFRGRVLVDVDGFFAWFIKHGCGLLMAHLAVVVYGSKLKTSRFQNKMTIPMTVTIALPCDL
jgi:hypothetical protein